MVSAHFPFGAHFSPLFDGFDLPVFMASLFSCIAFPSVSEIETYLGRLSFHLGLHDFS